MLGVLEKMDELAKVDKYGSGPYKPEIERLRELWESTIQMTRTGYKAEFEYGKPYDRCAESLYSKLEDTYIGVGFSAKDWKAAQALGDQFLDSSANPEATISLPVVLNAAWYGRVNKPDQADLVEKQARRLMKAFLKRLSDENLSLAKGAKAGPTTQTVTG
jgi:hypothetical protein